MEIANPQQRRDDASGRQFLLLLLSAILVVAVILGVLVYVISRPQTAAVEAGERHAIDECWRRSEDLAQSSPSRRFQEDSCREMAKQFQLKFQHRR
jgi:hypothetical protein